MVFSTVIWSAKLLKPIHNYFRYLIIISIVFSKSISEITARDLPVSFPYPRYSSCFSYHNFPLRPGKLISEKLLCGDLCHFAWICICAFVSRSSRAIFVGFYAVAVLHLWLAVGLGKEMVGHESSSASFGRQRHRETLRRQWGANPLPDFKDSQFYPSVTCCNCKDVKQGFVWLLACKSLNEMPNARRFPTHTFFFNHIKCKFNEARKYADIRVMKYY